MADRTAAGQQPARDVRRPEKATPFSLRALVGGCKLCLVWVIEKEEMPKDKERFLVAVSFSLCLEEGSKRGEEGLMRKTIFALLIVSMVATGAMGGTIETHQQL